MCKDTNFEAIHNCLLLVISLSVSQRTIERDLSALQKKGVLKHKGKDNDGTWIILKTKN